MIRRFSAAVVALAAALTITAAAPAGAAAKPPILMSDPSVSISGPYQGGTEVIRGCEAIYPPMSECGWAEVVMTLKGYDAYGGLTACDSWEQDDCDWSEFGSVGDTGSAWLHALISCGTSTRTRVVKVTLTPSGVREYSLIGSETRRDSNTARVSVKFEFPTPAVYGVCGDKATHLLRAKVFGVSVGMDGAKGVPDATFRVRGIFSQVI